MNRRAVGISLLIILSPLFLLGALFAYLGVSDSGGEFGAYIATGVGGIGGLIMLVVGLLGWLVFARLVRQSTK